MSPLLKNMELTASPSPPLQLEELSLEMKMKDFGYDAFSSMTRYLELNQQLSKLKVTDFVSTMTDCDGLERLICALVSHPNIDISIDCINNDLSEQSMDSLSNILQIIPQIRHLELRTADLNQLEIIGNVLSDSSCTLEYIWIYHENDDQDLDPIEQFEQINQIILDALKTNRSLKTLRYNYWEVDHVTDNADCMWPSFSRILCDKSSVDATYNSNHVLESLLINPLNEMPMEIYSLLHLNTNPNKHAVARQKIIRYHTFNNVDFVPSSLPTVLAWVGNEGTLSQLYGIVRNAPNEIRKNLNETEGTSAIN
jgi:hypothetical protein